MSSSRSSAKRLIILLVLLYLWWGLPFSLLLSGVIPEEIQLYGPPKYDQIRVIDFSSMLLVVWLFNTIIPIFPGAGLFSAMIGAATRDRPVSFLLGYSPYALTAFLFGLGGLVEGQWPLARVVALLASAVGFGLMGLGGALYGVWRSRPEVEQAGTARLSALLFLAGFTTWFIAFWIWPTWQL